MSASAWAVRSLAIISRAPASVLDRDKSDILIVPEQRKVRKQEVLPIDTPGGDRGIRTPDLCDANAVLSLLSYIPTILRL
jgi:hypothetical protein